MKKTNARDEGIDETKGIRGDNRWEDITIKNQKQRIKENNKRQDRLSQRKVIPRWWRKMKVLQEVLRLKWSAILATLFILFSYLLLLVIAKELKKRDIHGIRDSAWAAFILFLIQKGIDDSPKWLFICFFIGEILCIYSIINGLIRLSISIAYYIKTASNAEGKIISSVETIIVAFTAIISIVISLLK